MEFTGHEMTFPEADRRYADLKRQYDARDINNQEFDAQLKQLMVLDEEGRWWAKDREDGEWHYYDGQDWVKGTPPGYQPPPSPPAPERAPDGQRQPEQAGTSPSEGRVEDERPPLPQPERDERPSRTTAPDTLTTHDGEDAEPKLQGRRGSAVTSALAFAIAGIASLAAIFLIISGLGPWVNSLIFAIASAGALVGMLRLRNRQGASYGSLSGQVGFLATFVGLALAIVSFILLTLPFLVAVDMKGWELLGLYGAEVGLVLSGGGLVLLGIAALQIGALPRWGGWLLTGGGGLAILSPALDNAVLGFLTEDPPLYEFPILRSIPIRSIPIVGAGGMMVLSLVWLGLAYLLWSGRGGAPGYGARTEQVASFGERGAFGGTTVATAVAALSLLAIFVTVGLFLWRTNPVTDLKGMTLSEATQGSGNNVIVTVSPDEKPKGTIIDQLPKDGRSSWELPMLVTLSGGPERVKVPDVSGLDASRACEALVEAGLEPSVLQGRFVIDRDGDPHWSQSSQSNRIKKVAGTDPAAGEIVTPGTYVHLRG